MSALTIVRITALGAWLALAGYDRPAVAQTIPKAAASTPTPDLAKSSARDAAQPVATRIGAIVPPITRVAPKQPRVGATPAAAPSPAKAPKVPVQSTALRTTPAAAPARSVKKKPAAAPATKTSAKPGKANSVAKRSAKPAAKTAKSAAKTVASAKAKRDASRQVKSNGASKTATPRVTAKK